MSETTPHDPLKLKRYREAAEWVLQLNAPDAAEEDMDGWLQWCEADDDNLAAFEQLQRDWQDTQGFKTAPELLSCVDEPQSIRREAVPPNSKGRLWERRSVRWAVAVSGALIVVLSLQWWTQRPVYQVASAPNQEPATLPDGSSLLLSAKAIADVDFSGVTRRVALRPGGEAYIKVHHDKTRPFTVSAGAMTVTAVGTAFDVRREADRVIVTVEEGTVIAAATGPHGLTQWRAGAGYQVSYSEDVRTAMVSRVDTRSSLRWREGELAYDDVPLGSVITDINRYSQVSVVVRDPALLNLRFTGTVFVASVNDWVRALEAKYPVRARVSSNGKVELVPTGSEP